MKYLVHYRRTKGQHTDEGVPVACGVPYMGGQMGWTASPGNGVSITCPECIDILNGKRPYWRAVPDRVRPWPVDR